MEIDVVPTIGSYLGEKESLPNSSATRTAHAARTHLSQTKKSPRSKALRIRRSRPHERGVCHIIRSAHTKSGPPDTKERNSVQGGEGIFLRFPDRDSRLHISQGEEAFFPFRFPLSAFRLPPRLVILGLPEPHRFPTPSVPHVHPVRPVVPRAVLKARPDRPSQGSVGQNRLHLTSANPTRRGRCYLSHPASP